MEIRGGLLKDVLTTECKAALHTSKEVCGLDGGFGSRSLCYPCTACSASRADEAGPSGNPG